MAEITITRALVELKTLNDRINKAIANGNFIAYVTGKNSVTGYPTIKDFEDKARSTLQSINDLIKRRNQIKSAIVASNGVTEVEIAGDKITVAAAIERKTAISYEQALLNKLKQEYNSIVSKYEQEKIRVQDRLDALLAKTYEKDVKIKEEDYNAVAIPFKDNNDAKLIDPIGLKNEIDKLEDNITKFLGEVDFVLSESNSLTKISVPDAV